MLAPLTAAELDGQALRAAKGREGGTVRISGCHPSAGLDAAYAHGELVLYCNAVRCRKEILRVKVDPGGQHA